MRFGRLRTTLARPLTLMERSHGLHRLCPRGHGDCLGVGSLWPNALTEPAQ
jgi:hypothetical protein